MVLVVARRGPGLGLERPPLGVVLGGEVRGRPVRVGQVAQRQHVVRVAGADQVTGRLRVRLGGPALLGDVTGRHDRHR